MMIQASVIIPTFEDWDDLQKCLDCLVAQTVDQAQFEVIVANNNASPEVPASLRLPQNARVIHVPQPGSYAARNAAIAEARADVLFFTDSDCRPDARWIEAGLAAIAPLGPHGRVAGEVQIFTERERWTAAELFDRVHQLRQKDYFDLGWCVTANLVARRAAFDHAGLFDAQRFSGGDQEWGKRATALGIELVYDKSVLIRHPARARFADLARKKRRTTGGRTHEELIGKRPRKTLLKSMSLISYKELLRTMEYPNLSDGQRLKILGVCLCLGVVAFSEVVRLRYLSGTPRRS